jgi:hypothetical protein
LRRKCAAAKQSRTASWAPAGQAGIYIMHVQGMVSMLVWSRRMRLLTYIARLTSPCEHVSQVCSCCAATYLTVCRSQKAPITSTACQDPLFKQ